MLILLNENLTRSKSPDQIIHDYKKNNKKIKIEIALNTLMS